MATIVLSGAGAAAGAAIGGSVLGISSAVIGRAVGATVGRVIDQSLLGAGSQAVETGRVERFRLTGAGEGTPVGQCFGRVRVAGQVIWASRFHEHVEKSGGGGKGAPKTPTVTAFGYSVSLAIALCEGEITRIGRIWADGCEVAPGDFNLRIYSGSEDQLPDPKMEAVEGTGRVPAYRGIAYVMIEDLDLGRFGNRVPQFSFEVVRPAHGAGPDLASRVRGVALIPGTGEYSLATTPVYYDYGPGVCGVANVNSPSGQTDFVTSLEQMRAEMPGCRSVSLVVSWFGDDLRCGRCRVRPKVEQRKFEGEPMQWQVSGIRRGQAGLVPSLEERPVYGGTPADRAVMEAISEINAGGQEAVFYPFILMEQMAENGLQDPWSEAENQPVLPWRGRITLSAAPGRAGSPDGSETAVAQVRAFFGTARPGEFQRTKNGPVYQGEDGWSYRRFILHYAHLCAQAGGVSAFCLGSEMRALTQIRGPGNSFPAVAEMIRLAADLRAILGPETKIGYAADWSEYFGYHPQDGSGDVFFHLDPLWASEHVDFIGIDNYMPLSDWRDGNAHADAHWKTIYDPQYLRANIEGGEGYDWYYENRAAADAQRRTPITDGAYGEHWIWRYKDMRNWWCNTHHNRVGGVRQEDPTPWVPQSKPMWFTELGCGAIDKGTNQPNKFLDPKSSESVLPNYSTGARDDLIQAQYLNAMLGYWSEPENNPVSVEYGGQMIDMARAHVWAWDARPYPQFPARRDVWSDGDNYARGHWINGRISAQSLEAVVRDICMRSGVEAVGVRNLYGLVRGYTLEGIGNARAALQPLLLAYGCDAAERDGQIVFSRRDGRKEARLEPQALLAADGEIVPLSLSRAPEAETAGRIRLTFVEADGAYEARSVEAVFPDEESRAVAVTEFPLVLSGSEGRAIVDRWLAEARVARDRARFALPLSTLALGAGDVVRLDGPGGEACYRIDRVEQSHGRIVEAVRVEPGVYRPADAVEDRIGLAPFVPPVPVLPMFLDLPLLRGDEVPHAPHLAVAAEPWPGSVAVYSSAVDNGYELNRLIAAPAVFGVTETPLRRAAPGCWDRGMPLRVRLGNGALSSAEMGELLAGANLAAIGDGTHGWELFQFARARLVGPKTYELALRLRGQAGTEAEMAETWPEGSLFVLVDARVGQIDLAPTARGRVRHYRIGPAGRPYDDPTYRHRVEAFSGLGLRPYAPCHFRVVRRGRDVEAQWVRRTRVGGDDWEGEVPLGEALERYTLRVRNDDGKVVRQEVLSTPGWVYSSAAQRADGAGAGFRLEVAQVSDLFGPGVYASVSFPE
ncbi:putative tail protein [Rhodovulum imhoffii]|uniref:Putative tail protein n=1 Tax=Rhodovulum imhoffii TaxID=365340 RepID=A0A2T5BVA2_9RHOB|nr:glycoside hydrolase/phage tail family protein [Rhodovulum imhoffii]MBK5934240.1 host specificity protein [Rhodovulum imhoffii]PTN03513.1 putative tail protein [Rhodovulum imhoffii]